MDYAIDDIGGVQIYYYFTCKRQLWLYAQGVRFENQFDRVKIGKLVHDEFFKRQRHREVDAGSIKIDFVGKGAEVHEVKSSSRYKEEHAWQLRFYLYYLKKYKGVPDVRGVLHYPESRQKMQVTLAARDEDYISKVVAEIKDIVAGERPPAKEKKRTFCEKCAYFDYCYI